MSEHPLANQSLENSAAVCDPQLPADNTAIPPLVELLQEIQATPIDQWPDLLQMIRFFRENCVSPAPASVVSPLHADSSLDEGTQSQLLTSEALRYWKTGTDEHPSLETWDSIHRALAIDFRIEEGRRE